MTNDDKGQISSLRRQGLALLQAHRLEEARTLFTHICEISPEDADSWFKLGTLNGMLGDIEEAGICCRKVIALQPDHGEAHANLGNVLFYKGRHDEAIEHYRTAIRINPGNAAAHNNLGNALKSTGHPDEAMESYKCAIAANPNYVVAHYNFGIALQEVGRPEEAGDCFRRAVALNPNYAEAYNNLGTVLKGQLRLEEAKDALQRALAIKPNYAEAIYNLANVYLAMGQLEAAVEHFRQAIFIKPDYADAYNNLGNALNELGQAELAIENHKRAIALNPEHVGAFNNLGIILRNQGRMQAAEDMIMRALQIQPDFADAYNTLGNIRSWQGNASDAVKMFQKTLELSPDQVKAHSNFLMTMHYLPDYSAEDLLAAAREWNARHAQDVPVLTPPANLPDPNRRLRIGYVSGDFCSHPVGFFIEAVLSHHDKQLFEIFCYYNDNIQDDLNSRLRKCADKWRNIERLSDQAVAERIRQDGIDILIDLSGHTFGHRLLAFARRPSPIQATWMGYFATTGLAAMDYIIADRYVIPSEEERYYTENVERLPDGYLCFTTPDLPLPVAPLPALSQGAITFGCFNNPAKLTPEVVACWSTLLHALPDARLLLKYKSLADEKVRKHFQDLFAAHSVDVQRIKFSGQSPRDEYLASYNEIDICLDPFPFNGCTTTVEALWMGIPVITLRGNRFAGHMGETIMKNLNLGEFVADNQDSYVKKAIALAADLSRLSRFRSSMRDQLKNSPLCNGIAFTRDLESIYRKIWTNWCDAQINSKGT